MILGYHLILRAYGTWFHNDPRGGWSQFIASWELVLAHARTSNDAQATILTALQNALKRPPVEWTGKQALLISRGFEEVSQHWQVQCYACSILPTHVHLVIGRTNKNILQVMTQLKSRASLALSRAAMHPFQSDLGPHNQRPTCWSHSGWKIYLNSLPDIKRAIQYVNNNPQKEGKRPQHWPWITPHNP